MPMVGPDDIQDPTKVALAADVLLERYGSRALERAVRLEEGSNARAFAAAVRLEIEKRLGKQRRDI